MKEYIVSREYINGIYTDEGSTFGLDMQKELIRCKDCVKYKIFGDGYCPWIEQEVEEDFFCADGMRKEE